ncbi:MAG: HDOD domain-containing protein [Chitinispirillia bacterium]|jgi:HD-like signal output (HDOD) protein
MSYTIESVITKLEENMPSLSPTASKIIQLASNINTSPPELTKVIKLDPVLSAKVLKLVNSSYFAVRDRIVSLEKAVIMLGLNTIKNLALSAAVLTQVGSNSKKIKFDNNEFWKHSLAVGITAKLIARKRNIDKKIIEDYFIAGLLHDLGLLVESIIFPEEMTRILTYCQKDGLLISEAIELGGMDGLNHCKIGELLAEKWKLSSNLKNVMVMHHDPFSNDNPSDLDATIYLANIICKNNSIGLVLDKTPVEQDPAVYSKLGTDKSIEKLVLEDIEDEIVKAMEFLKA